MKLSSPAYLVVSLVSVVTLSANQDFDASRCPGLSNQQVENGWISLFDGQSLFGWRSQPNDVWPVRSEALQLTKRAKQSLRTSVQFDDFELQLEYKLQNASMAGIWIRTNPQAQTPNADGYKISLARGDGANWPSGSIEGIQRSKELKQEPEWNRLRIRAEGNQLQTWINDELVVNQTGARELRKGYIAFRHDRGEVAIRKVSVLPLSLQPLLNDRELDSWDLRLQQQSRFSLGDDGVLNMTSGPGQIATKKEYGDFVFQTHVQTAAEGLNSGIFFRCIAGELMNGYESQIQNQIRDGDPTKPVDCGTGGIFRRQDARWVNAKDKHWWTQTIVADGATMAVWVNGLQVVDWTDRRKPNANPRRGLRLKAGTIILQGHDPTTNVNFKQVAVRELATRRH